MNLENPDFYFAVVHEKALLDDIIYRDVVDTGERHAYFSTGWTAFLVANRLHEQLMKLSTPEFQWKRRDKQGIGHFIKDEWHDKLAAESPQKPFFEQLNIAYGWMQAMLQTPWPTLGDMYAEVQSTHNKGEYTLLNMGSGDAPHGVHPLLPCLLADIINLFYDLLLGRAHDENGEPSIQASACSIHRIGHSIGMELPQTEHVNLNIDLMNEVYAAHKGKMGMWSHLLHVLANTKREVQLHETRVLIGGDGTPMVGSVVQSPSGKRREYEEQRAMAVLLRVFNDDRGVAAAHYRWANLLLLKRDWRLQLFRRISECRPMQQHDGVWHDASNGRWWKTARWGCNRPTLR